MSPYSGTIRQYSQDPSKRAKGPQASNHEKSVEPSRANGQSSPALPAHVGGQGNLAHPSRNNRHRKLAKPYQPPIFLGRETALQLLRVAQPRRGAQVQAQRNPLQPPEYAPRQQDIDAMVARLEASYPEVRIKRPIHLFTSKDSRHKLSSAYQEHVCNTSAPRGSFFWLSDDVCASEPPLAAIQSAAHMAGMIEILELCWEMCGTYQSWRTGMPTGYDVTPLTSRRILRNYLARCPSMNGKKKLAHAMRYLADGSASARETKQALVLGLPMAYGGCGLGIPRMNFEVMASDAARAMSGKGSFRCDLCWPEARLDVEYQSRENHEGEAHRIGDSLRANALAAMGWTVMGITNEELDSLVATDVIAQTISRKLGKRLQVRVSNYHARKLKLRRQLGLPLERY